MVKKQRVCILELIRRRSIGYVHLNVVFNVFVTWQIGCHNARRVILINKRATSNRLRISIVCLDSAAAGSPISDDTATACAAPQDTVSHGEAISAEVACQETAVWNEAELVNDLSQGIDSYTNAEFSADFTFIS
jgi:hypothetical protein